MPPIRARLLIAAAAITPPVAPRLSGMLPRRFRFTLLFYADYAAAAAMPLITRQRLPLIISYAFDVYRARYAALPDTAPAIRRRYATSAFSPVALRLIR